MTWKILVNLSRWNRDWYASERTLKQDTTGTKVQIKVEFWGWVAQRVSHFRNDVETERLIEQYRNVAF